MLVTIFRTRRFFSEYIILLALISVNKLSTRYEERGYAYTYLENLDFINFTRVRIYLSIKSLSDRMFSSVYIKNIVYPVVYNDRLPGGGVEERRGGKVKDNYEFFS